MKLSYSDIEQIIAECEAGIYYLNFEKSHKNKVMMLVLLDLKTKAERKICGLKKHNGYTFKLQPVHKEVLLYLRNECYNKKMLYSVSITKLLEINN